jgi:hypothetical protein
MRRNEVIESGGQLHSEADHPDAELGAYQSPLLTVIQVDVKDWERPQFAVGKANKFGTQAKKSFWCPLDANRVDDTRQLT